MLNDIVLVFKNNLGINLKNNKNNNFYKVLQNLFQIQ